MRTFKSAIAAVTVLTAALLLTFGSTSAQNNQANQIISQTNEGWLVGAKSDGSSVLLGSDGNGYLKVSPNGAITTVNGASFSGQSGIQTFPSGAVLDGSTYAANAPNHLVIYGTQALGVSGVTFGKILDGSPLTNYEIAQVGWSSNIFFIGTSAGGTGTIRTINIGNANGGFNVNGSNGDIAMLPGDNIRLGPSGGSLMTNTKVIGTNTAPTISSGFGTSPSIPSANGTFTFTVNVGTGGTADSGVLTLPTATTGWQVHCENLSTRSATVFDTKQTATTTTSATIGNFNTSGAAAAWVASDVLLCSASAY